MNISHLGQIINKKIKTKAIFVLMAIVISTFLEILGISLILPLIAYLFTNEYPEKFNFILEFFFNKNLIQSNLFLLLFLSCLIIYFLKNIFLTFSSILESQFVWSTKKYLSEKIISNYFKSNYYLNLKENSSYIINILTKEVSYLVHYLMSLILLVSEVLILISISILMTVFYPKIFTSIFFFSIFFLYLFNVFTKKKISLFANKRLNTDTIYLKKATEIVSGFREIIIYNKKDYFISDFANNNTEIYKINWKLEFLQKIPRYWLEYFIIAFILILLFIFTKLNYNNHDILIIASAIVISASRLLPSAAKFYRAYQQLKIYKPSIDVIFKEINKKKYISINYHKKNNQKLIFKKNIVFHNISFSYDKKKIFEKLNLEIKKNSMIGIYGSNGVGKSTLMDILFGFIKAKTGNINVDGQNIKKNILDWQSTISYIPQKIYLTDGSILENIIFNDIHSLNLEDKKRLKKVITLSELDDFIRNLPKGIKTIVGERGNKISGGQAQRIGLARALYKSPQVLVMDEATNSIDRQASKKIINTVKNLDYITRIIVSHDFEILKKCEKNYRISNNKILELNL